MKMVLQSCQMTVDLTGIIGTSKEIMKRFQKPSCLFVWGRIEEITENHIRILFLENFLKFKIGIHESSPLEADYFERN